MVMIDESEKQSLNPDGDPDHQQNLIICSMAHCQPSLKISCKSFRKFSRNVANRQTTTIAYGGKRALKQTIRKIQEASLPSTARALCKICVESEVKTESKRKRRNDS